MTEAYNRYWKMVDAKHFEFIIKMWLKKEFAIDADIRVTDYTEEKCDD